MEPRFESFAEVALRYRAIFFDAYGVLRNSSGLIPGVSEMLDFLAEHDIDYYVLTNDASRSPALLAAKYHQYGIPQITADKIVSSGMLARDYLQQKVREGAVAYLGTESSAHYLEELGLQTVAIRALDLDFCEEINCLVVLDDEGFDWNTDINKTINLLRRRNIPVVIANTDLSYPTSMSQVAAATGAVANLIESVLGKQFLRFGKPGAQMFIFAYEHIQQFRPVPKIDILMVGDTLHTDILGGNKFGLDTCLVLSGNTLPDQYAYRIRSTGIIPDFVCESVAVR
jgi:HAD superfamily hydrolase (TIGR01450 family)